MRPLTDVWPILLRDRLPTAPVPLAAGDADVSLDLQRALANVYDAVGYDLLIDYTQPPPVPMTGPDAEWARQLTQKA